MNNDTTLLENYESVLVVVKDKTEIWPLNTVAFSVTQCTKTDLSHWDEATVLYRDGRIKKITNIKIEGFLGKTIFSKIMSILFGVYKITVCLDNSEMSFSELSKTISDLIYLDSKKYDRMFEIDNIEDIVDKIRCAKNASQIFELINMPQLEDCLDIL